MKYSNEFETAIREFLSSRSKLDRYEVYVNQGLDLRYNQIIKYVIPEIQYHLGDMSEMTVLDYCCGIGATTVALAEKCKYVYAADIDEASLHICNLRVKEHKVEEKVKIVNTDNLKREYGKIKFDIVLMNGVIEHIPISEHNLRRRVIQDAFSYVKEGGHLYINDTPCRLWPKDIHTTNLWLISYFKPGSMLAYKYAVRFKKHTDNPAKTLYGKDLEIRGVWGSHYWEIIKSLRGYNYHCINLDIGHNKNIFYKRIPKAKRHILETFMFLFAGKLFDVPITAFSSYINNLIFKKTEE